MCDAANVAAANVAAGPMREAVSHSRVDFVLSECRAVSGLGLRVLPDIKQFKKHQQIGKHQKLEYRKRERERTKTHNNKNK